MDSSLLACAAAYIVIALSERERLRRIGSSESDDDDDDDSSDSSVTDGSEDDSDCVEPLEVAIRGQGRKEDKLALVNTRQRIHPGAVQTNRIFLPEAQVPIPVLTSTGRRMMPQRGCEKSVAITTNAREFHRGLGDRVVTDSGPSDFTSSVDHSREHWNTDETEAALLRLRVDKLLLELDKLREDRERIAAEQRNIALRTTIAGLRLRLSAPMAVAHDVSQVSQEFSTPVHAAPVVQTNTKTCSASLVSQLSPNICTNIIPLTNEGGTSFNPLPQSVTSGSIVTIAVTPPNLSDGKCDLTNTKSRSITIPSSNLSEERMNTNTSLSTSCVQSQNTQISISSADRRKRTSKHQTGSLYDETSSTSVPSSCILPNATQIGSHLSSKLDLSDDMVEQKVSNISDILTSKKSFPTKTSLSKLPGQYPFQMVGKKSDQQRTSSASDEHIGSTVVCTMEDDSVSNQSIPSLYRAESNAEVIIPDPPIGPLEGLLVTDLLQDDALGKHMAHYLDCTNTGSVVIPESLARLGTLDTLQTHLQCKQMLDPVLRASTSSEAIVSGLSSGLSTVQGLSRNRVETVGVDSSQVNSEIVQVISGTKEVKQELDMVESCEDIDYSYCIGTERAMKHKTEDKCKNTETVPKRMKLDEDNY